MELFGRAGSVAVGFGLPGWGDYPIPARGRGRGRGRGREQPVGGADAEGDQGVRSVCRSYSDTLNGVGRIDQQTFIDTYAKVAFAKLYDRKTPITAADLLNDRVLSFFEEHAIALCRILTDRGTEYCGTPERHEYELYLAVEDIDHTRTKAKSPQTNGICERFHKKSAGRVLPGGVP